MTGRKPHPRSFLADPSLLDVNTIHVDQLVIEARAEIHDRKKTPPTFMFAGFSRLEMNPTKG
jgi:hypothetical protein